MDSSPESEFGKQKIPVREVSRLPKPSRPKVIFSNEGSLTETDPTSEASHGLEPQSPPIPRSGTSHSAPRPVQKFVPEQVSAEAENREPKLPTRSSSAKRPLTIPEDPNFLPPVESCRNAASRTRRDREASDESNGMGGLYFLLASAALMFGIWFIGPRLVEEYHYAARLGRARAEYDNAVIQLEKQPLANVSYAYQLVAQRIRPSVVSVNAIKSNRNGVADGSGLGSGVIMSTDGYILTNAHVLEEASVFKIQLHDRREFDASLVGVDLISDLALLKIDAPNLKPATWGDSDSMNVGSIVWAIGSPYGFQQTVTSGIISGKDRPGDRLHPKQSLLQTDAAVNPGNSGGPLVDARGRVIGINTSIFGDTFQGISFAVPSATAKFVYQQLIQNGRVTRGYLGVVPTEVDHRDAIRMKLPDLDGAKLQEVRFGSPAHRAGIRQWDVIRTWNGVDVKDYKHLFRLAEMTRPDTRVEVSLVRNGKEQLKEVTVGTFPDSPRLFSRQSPGLPK